MKRYRIMSRPADPSDMKALCRAPLNVWTYTTFSEAVARAMSDGRPCDVYVESGAVAWTWEMRDTSCSDPFTSDE